MIDFVVFEGSGVSAATGGLKLECSRTSGTLDGRGDLILFENWTVLRMLFLEDFS